jgi:glycine oxidase
MHDCLILGGGVIGLSLAYELAGKGLNCQLLERGHVGGEASWAGAGILPAANLATAIDPIDKLRGLSHHLHGEWAGQLQQQTGIDTGYRQCGGIYLARGAGEAASLAGLMVMLGEEGIDSEQLQIDQLSEYEPQLAAIAKSGQLRSAYRVPGDSQLRNPDHLAALKAACLELGVLIQEQVEVTELVVEGAKMTHVEADGREWFAESFCIASGAWTTLLLGKLGIPNGILPVRGQMVLFRCQQPPLSHIVSEGSRYLVPRDDGRLLVGSSEEEVGFVKGTTEQVIEELKGLARELVPSLESAEVERCWSGLRPGSFDGFPYLGRLPGVDNAYVAAGHFRSGLQLSTGTAVVMSELIRGDALSLDLTPFRVDRG